MKHKINFLMILFLFFISCNNELNEKRKKSLNNKFNFDKKIKNSTNKFNRKLDEQCENWFRNDTLFHDLQIYVDTLNFEKDFDDSGLSQYKTTIINSMKRAAEILGSILMIMEPVLITIEDADIEDELGISLWNRDYVKQDVVGISTQTNYFVIWSKIAESTDEIIGNRLAIGRPVFPDYACSYPLYGLMTFNPNENYYLNLNPDYLTIFFLRQFTNILAFNDEVLENDFDFEGILNMDEEPDHYYIQSEKVVEFASNYFNCYDRDFTKIEILKDNFGNFYWPERYLLGEYMTEEEYPEEKAISNFTLLLLEELKYLRVKKYYTGGLMKFGKHKGCDFIKEKYNKANKKFGNEFFYPQDGINEEPSCSSGRQSKTIFKLIEYENEIPADFQYFESGQIGGLKSADYCPVPQFFISEHFSVGHCSDTNNSPVTERGESFSQNSFCALSSLLKTSSSQTESIKAICFEMFCSDNSLTIKFMNDFFVCPKVGGIIQGVGYKGAILCPDYNLICTGTQVCNNLLNCFDKHSYEKESSISYEEGYDIETTQISSIYLTKIENEEFLFKGELSDNGLCPKYCFQCQESINNKNNKYSCVKCQKNYKLDIENNICINKIENCKEFNDEENCIECIDNNYGLVKNNENDETICLKISDMKDEYLMFSDDSKNYYKKCSDIINNCKTCSSTTFCTSCFVGYGMVDNINNNCIELNDNYYFDSDLNTYKICSYKNPGCKACLNIGTNDIICKECDSAANYVLIYDILNYCKLQTDLENDKSIFFDSKTLKYLACSDSRYHSVKNCNTCHNKDKCDTCKSGYEMANSNELCLSYSDINQNVYYKNTLDNKYYLCSNVIKGCEICENGEKCTHCYIGFDLEENDKCIPTALAMTRYYLNNETGKYVSCTKIENCEECISNAECTKCINGYELNNSSCNIIENIKTDENKNEKDDGKLKALATAAIVLGTLGLAFSIVAIILILLKKFCKKSKSISDPTESQNINNDPNEIVVKSNKRSLHNEPKE